MIELSYVVADIIDWLINNVMLPAALAIVPSWITYVVSSYFFLKQKTANAHGDALPGSNGAPDTGVDFHANTVVSATLAAGVSLFVLAVLLVVAWQGFLEYKDNGTAIADMGMESSRIHFRSLAIAAILVIFLWLGLALYHIVKAVIKLPVLGALIQIYIVFYVVLGVLEGVNVPVLRVVDYGYTNVFTFLISGPSFIADQVALSFQLERWSRFLFSFVILFCVLKYVVGLIVQKYRKKKEPDAFDFDAIKIALNAFVWLLSLVLSVATLEFEVGVVGIFIAAVGAGVAISFREVLSNFFSGVLLNIDKSIKKGDIIRTLDGMVGKVNQISLRYTELKTKDYIDILIPNSELVHSRFENLSRNDGVVRLSLRFWVGQNVDIDLIERLALKACRYVPQVSAVAGEGRTPSLFYLGPSERGNQFDLRFWVVDASEGPAMLQSEVAKAIFRQFKNERIRSPMLYMNINIDDGGNKGFLGEGIPVAPETGASPRG